MGGRGRAQGVCGWGGVGRWRRGGPQCEAHTTHLEAVAASGAANGIQLLGQHLLLVGTVALGGQGTGGGRRGRGARKGGRSQQSTRQEELVPPPRATNTRTPLPTHAPHPPPAHPPHRVCTPRQHAARAQRRQRVRHLHLNWSLQRVDLSHQLLLIRGQKVLRVHGRGWGAGRQAGGWAGGHARGRTSRRGGGGRAGSGGWFSLAGRPLTLLTMICRGAYCAWAWWWWW